MRGEDNYYLYRAIQAVMMAAMMMALMGVMAYILSTFNDPDGLGSFVFSDTPHSSQVSSPQPTQTVVPTPVPAPIPSPPPPPAPADYTMPLVLGGVLVLGLVVAGGVYYTKPRVVKVREARSALREEMKARTKLWEETQKRFNAVRQAYIDYEMDLVAVLFEKRSLADITDPLTAAFHEKFQEAQDRMPESMPSSEETLHAINSVVIALEVAWKAANANAVRKSSVWLAGHPARVLADVMKAEKLVKTAMDSATTADAAKTYLDKAQQLLDSAGIDYARERIPVALGALEKRNQKALCA